jgi:hypothetical protein
MVHQRVVGGDERQVHPSTGLLMMRLNGYPRLDGKPAMVIIYNWLRQDLPNIESTKCLHRKVTFTQPLTCA